jgi:uncharacterized membrane protein YvbJ
MSPEICPNCGAAVARGAKACRECGSDAETGWSEAAERATARDLGIPEEEFDYEEFTQREFGGATPKPRGISWFWWLVAVVLLIVGLMMWLG